MVSARCKMVVRDELKKLGLHFMVVELGEVDIMETLTEDQRLQLKQALLNSGLELMDNKRAILIERIKTTIIEMVHHTDGESNINFSDFLSKKLEHNYTYLANLFSEVQGTTIEQFIISHKVERIKELIIYDELNITEIAWKMNYSSVAHLSNQFKKVTGLTPTHFKQLKDKSGNQQIDVSVKDACNIVNTRRANKDQLFTINHKMLSANEKMTEILNRLDQLLQTVYPQVFCQGEKTNQVL